MIKNFSNNYFQFSYDQSQQDMKASGINILNIRVSGSDILPGGGSSAITTFAALIIPAKPQTIDELYWGPVGAGSHDTTGNVYGATGISVPSIDGNRKLYTGTISEGEQSRKSGDEPGSTISNIVMAKDSLTGPANYSMSFTPFDASATGHYGTTNRLFDFGDRGSLIVRINGDRVVNYDLGAEFNAVDAHQTQDITGEREITNAYTGNGTASFADIDDTLTALEYANKGRLILTRVESFNGANSNYSFTNQGIEYPYGYQGWSARIEIDGKLRDGYNKLEFSHYIDENTIQNWQPFEWYYDDGIILADTPSTATASFTDTGTQTFALSGVKFFKIGTDIDMELKDAHVGIAGPTYPPKTQTILQIEPGTGVSINSDTATVDFNLNSDNGLRFGANGDIIPNINESGSTEFTIRDYTTPAPPPEPGTGRDITVTHLRRNFASDDSFAITADNVSRTISVGRFATEPTTNSTNNIENFFKETYRYKKDTVENNRNITQAGGSVYWISTTNADYDSDQNILSTEDLQVHYIGGLRYPQNTYPSNLPDIADYSNATGDRYFYRAFDIGTGDQLINKLKFTIGIDPNNQLNETDLLSGNTTYYTGNTDFDGNDIRIDVCLPGPVAAGNGNNTNNPGTGWGVVTSNNSGMSTSHATDDWNAQSFGAPYEFVPPGTTQFNLATFQQIAAPADANVILMGLGNVNTTYTNGIVLCRVRYKSSATQAKHVITRLQIEGIA